MRHAVSVLGSTGSVGKQTLEVMQALGIKAVALSADTNIGLLEEQARKFKPAVAAVMNEKAAADLKLKLADTDTKVVSGLDGLIEAAAAEGSDTVVTAVSGSCGLMPTMEAIRAGKRIALANKETLVCAGELVMQAVREHDCELIPVDSEHSAIFQCLNGHSREVKKLLLTASGGPFRGKTREQLRNVTKEAALKHPNWTMGAKITIDSATLMNKGLEFIEAMHLFGVSPDQIQILVHPQSIVHSMVEFCDNAVIAQLGAADMRLPIQYALTYPERCPSIADELDIFECGSLTFERPDLNTFPCLGLAIKTAQKRGTACAVMNAANEEAVRLFLNDRIGFYQIYELLCFALEAVPNIEDPELEDIIEADKAAREIIKKQCIF